MSDPTIEGAEAMIFEGETPEWLADEVGEFSSADYKQARTQYLEGNEEGGKGAVRLIRGIRSLERQIAEHEEKIRLAHAHGPATAEQRIAYLRTAINRFQRGINARLAVLRLYANYSPGE